MRTPTITPLRVALLSTWIVGAAGTLHADGPLVVPHDRAVDVAVEAPADPAVLTEAATASEPGVDATHSAELAHAAHEDQPLGDAVGPLRSPEDAAAPSARESAFATSRDEMIRVGGPLVGVVALMVVLGAAVRRFGGPLARGGRPSGVLEVLGRYPIARGQQLVLLRMVSRVVLLHQSRGSLTTLSEVTDADEVAALLARVESASRSAQPGRFQGMLTGAAARQDEFGRTMTNEGKVVVDLTRRPAHRALRSAEA